MHNHGPVSVAKYLLSTDTAMLENWLYQEVKCDIAMEINHQFCCNPFNRSNLASNPAVPAFLKSWDGWVEARSNHFIWKKNQRSVTKWMSEKVVIENLIRTTASAPSIRSVEGIAVNISPLRLGHGCALTEGEVTSK